MHQCCSDAFASDCRRFAVWHLFFYYSHIGQWPPPFPPPTWEEIKLYLLWLRNVFPQMKSFSHQFSFLRVRKPFLGSCWSNSYSHRISPIRKHEQWNTRCKKFLLMSNKIMISYVFNLSTTCSIFMMERWKSFKIYKEDKFSAWTRTMQWPYEEDWMQDAKSSDLET